MQVSGDHDSRISRWWAYFSLAFGVVSLLGTLGKAAVA